MVGRPGIDGESKGSLNGLSTSSDYADVTVGLDSDGIAAPTELGRNVMAGDVQSELEVIRMAVATQEIYDQVHGL